MFKSKLLVLKISGDARAVKWARFRRYSSFNHARNKSKNPRSLVLTKVRILVPAFPIVDWVWTICELCSLPADNYSLGNS